MGNKDQLRDTINLLSLALGMANYEENLTQNDKSDLIKEMSNSNSELLSRIETDLEEQNVMLREILKRLEEISHDNA